VAHVIQLRQNSQAGIHPSLNAVLRTYLLGLVESAGGDLAGDALLPAHFVQVVNSYGISADVQGIIIIGHASRKPKLDTTSG
jgi:hypothetical protein